MKKTVPLFLLLLSLVTAGAAPAQTASPESAKKGPRPDAKVLFIFVDSLRPDVVDDMVAKGQLPTIKKLFYDKGLRFPNFFSTFPSLTVNAYGELITGKWPDRSGLKAQSLFERFPVRKKNFLKRAFRIPENYPRYFNMLTKVEKPPEILKRNKIKTLYDYLGEKFHSSVVPVSPYVAPWAWPHIAANDVDRPYFVATEAANRIDDLNGKYGLRYMVPDDRGRLFMIWFTEMDEEQHRHPWGQFDSEVRQRMIKVDQWMGKIYDGLIKKDGGKVPYVILFSDHGSYGGKDGIYNQHYYLGRDFFYQVLKMNVQGPDFVMNHPGADTASFTYIDNMGRGQARIFLPAGDISSDNWTRPNTLYELTHYGRGPNRKPVNLVRALLTIDLSARNKFPGTVDAHPVDLVFVKISDELIYVARQGGAEALIQIERNDGAFRYRYKPVQNVAQDQNGKLTYDENFTADPFGYLKHPKFHAPDALTFIRDFHNDAEWLEATQETDYPDAITVLSRALSWSPELSGLAKSQDPDLWISATPGWNFRIEDLKGSDHGSIFRDSIRSTLMLSGPGIRSGVDPKPYRILDVTPTVFQLLGYTKKTNVDSVPIGGIYED